ncbi:hypothetical protein CTI12_AA380140 [Artemisia annua]|uniref:Helitron helicase-like domain-containing protein n=1 Tax=Artemisia annua TaxID=35608 RepID=A0A2U1MHF8_ARTAN|nr:hypothetical protein CTI12_AA380140 [Artemisia annua]
MPKRLLRNEFAQFANTYMHNFTNNYGFEDRQLSESETHLQYNGPSITDTEVSAENDSFIGTISHDVGPSNVNSNNLDLYGQQQSLSVLGKNQPFYQQLTSIPNGNNPNEIHYLGQSTATMSENLETKKDAPAIPDRRKRRIAAMYRDELHLPKRCKGIHIREGSYGTTESHSCAVYNDETVANTLIPENATDMINETGSSQNEREHVHQNPMNNPTTTTSITPDIQDVSPLYIDIGDSQYACQYCNAAFWYSERSKKSSEWRNLKYTKCCAGGQVYLEKELDPPMYFKQIFKDKHFLDNIRAYNQMFRQIHHWIGTICPTNKDEPKFMQIYMFDTENEIAHRMEPFGEPRVTESTKAISKISKFNFTMLLEIDDMTFLLRALLEQ